MDNPLVSILINNYNYDRFLSAAIDSALNQTYRHQEIIVVDDGSTDNSREIIASYGDKVRAVLKENGGQSSAFNAGFAASRGDIICFLDSDDTFAPSKVAKVVKAFSDRTDLGWCFHPMTSVDINGNSIHNHTNNQSENRQREYDCRQQIKNGNWKDKFPPPSTSGLCFRRSLIAQILPMPEATTIGLNDGYLEFTALGLGKGVFLDAELGGYRIHGSNAYTMRGDKKKVQARINVLTAYWMRVNFPAFCKFTNRLFAVGIGFYWRAGGVAPEAQEIVQKYWSMVSLKEKLDISALASYYYLKNPQY